MTREVRRARESGRNPAALRMRDCLRNLGIALAQGAVLLITFSALYILAYLVFYQRFPRWK